jgi:hypothetical protein
VASYRLVSVKDIERREWYAVSYVETPQKGIVRLADASNETIAIIHLAEGERIEREK